MCLGIPGKIVRITDTARRLGVVEVEGIQRSVNLGCVAEENADLHHLVGRWVLVHVGFAMSLIDEAQALATLAILAELGEVQSELAAMQAGAS